MSECVTMCHIYFLFFPKHACLRGEQLAAFARKLGKHPIAAFGRLTPLILKNRIVAGRPGLKITASIENLRVTLRGSRGIYAPPL